MQKKLLVLFFLLLGSVHLQAQFKTDSLLTVVKGKSILQQDVLRVLSGIYPGVQINSTGGLTGSGTNAIIRGFTSLNATSDPLIIVDGIRVDGQNNQNSSTFSGGGTLTTPNRSIDINPSEIIDIKVLNSLSATIRYGEEARNGVILIKTSRSQNNLSEDKIEITYEQGFYNSIISSRPDYQNKYGMGFSGNNSATYSSWGPEFSSSDEAIFNTNFVGFDTDGTVLINHPLSRHEFTSIAFPELADESYRYEAKPSAIEGFFNNGFSTTTILGANYRSGNYLLNINYAGSWEDGFTPENSLKRNNFGANFRYPLIDNVQGRSSLQLAYTDIDSPALSAGSGSGRVQAAAGPSIFSDIFYTPRSLGFDFPFQNPDNGGSAYYRVGNDIINPRWTLNNTKTINSSNRIIGFTEVLFNPSDRIEILYNYSFESYDENQEYRLNPSFVANYPFPTGLYQTIDVSRTFYEQLLLFKFQKVQAGNFSFNFDAGLSYLSESIEEAGIESIDIRELGVFKHSNFRTQLPINSFSSELFAREYDRRTFALFAIANLEYDKFIEAEFGVRGVNNNSLQQQDLNAWYPSIQLSYSPIHHFRESIGFLSEAKFQIGYSTSGRSIFNEQEILVQNRASVRINNDIKPERSIEKQLGLTLGFFENRIRLRSTYYRQTHTDLISRIADNSDPTFSSILDNLMEIESEGLEISLFTKPLQNSIEWSIQTNFSTISTEVKEYTGSFNAVQLGNSLSSRGNAALIDEPFMIMYGVQILKVDEQLIESNTNFNNVPVGTPIIDDSGNYIQGSVGIIGNPTPKWNASMIHQASYKNIGLSIQLDYQHGGDMYSTWIASLLGRGVVTETTKDDRNEMFVIEGVGIDGEPNEIEISAQQYYFNNILVGPDQVRVFDMTHFRISHISLDYNLPSKWLRNSRIHQVKISLSVENAFLYMPNIPEGLGFDPNVNSNGAGVNNMGFEYLTGPAARRYGGAIRVKF